MRLPAHPGSPPTGPILRCRSSSWFAGNGRTPSADTASGTGTDSTAVTGADIRIPDGAVIRTRIVDGAVTRTRIPDGAGPGPAIAGTGSRTGDGIRASSGTGTGGWAGTGTGRLPTITVTRIHTAVAVDPVDCEGAERRSGSGQCLSAVVRAGMTLPGPRKGGHDRPAVADRGPPACTQPVRRSLRNAPACRYHARGEGPQGPGEK